jgi:hypothetical protein
MKIASEELETPQERQNEKKDKSYEKGSSSKSRAVLDVSSGC